MENIYTNLRLKLYPDLEINFYNFWHISVFWWRVRGG